MISLQKLLAEAGLAARRTIEEWIRAGRVSVADRAAREPLLYYRLAGE